MLAVPHKEILQNNQNSKTSQIVSQYHSDIENNLLQPLTNKFSKLIEEIKSLEYSNSEQIEKDINSSLNMLKETVANIKQQAKEENKKQGLDVLDFVKEIEPLQVGNAYSFTELLRIYEEGEIRYSNLLPPGYEDKDKNPNGEKKSNGEIILNKTSKYGDLILWKQLLEKAKNDKEKRNILFVTNETKEDWWTKDKNRQNIIIGPRPELLEEFNEYTDKSQKFYMIFADDFFNHISSEDTQNINWQELFSKNYVDYIIYSLDNLNNLEILYSEIEEHFQDNYSDYAEDHSLLPSEWREDFDEIEHWPLEYTPHSFELRYQEDSVLAIGNVFGKIAFIGDGEVINLEIDIKINLNFDLNEIMNGLAKERASYTSRVKINSISVLDIYAD